MIFYIVFDGDGRELKRGSCQPECLELQATNASDTVVEIDRNVFDQSPVHYLENGVVEPCREFDLTVTTNCVTGIPAGTLATFEDHSTDIITDGEIEFESDVTDIVLVHFSHREYRETTIEIEVRP